MSSNSIMVATTSTRRPLAALDQNASTPSKSSGLLLGTKVSSTKPQIKVNIPMEDTCALKTAAASVGENELGDEKRHYSHVDEISWSNKRQKMEVSPKSRLQTEDQSWNEGTVAAPEQIENSSADEEEIGNSEKTPKVTVNDVSYLHDVASSPISSCQPSILSPIAVDDFQITTLHLPDDLGEDAAWSSPRSDTPHLPLTVGEMKQKAKEIRLRLSLANYKVRTNQIDVPIARLQIRPSAHARIPGTSRILTDASQRRTPLPSSSLPNINLQQPSAGKTQLHTHTIPSSPPSPRVRSDLISPVKPKVGTASELSTPLLPRQRQGLLNPPTLDFRTWEDRARDVTSSVVKVRAADGLLSLMSHHG